MFFRCKKILLKFIHNQIKQSKSKRKETLSPEKIKKTTFLPPKSIGRSRRRTFFFAPFQASLTVEAAAALSVFFICMAGVLQVGNVMGAAVRFGSALTETGEQMALNAYAAEYGEGNSLVMGALSALYARSSVLGKAGDTEAVKNENFLFSSFLREDEMIHLVMTYQIKSSVGIVKIPGVFFLQRSSVRGWTGRTGSGGDTESNSDESSGQKVFVTEHGTVYHTDINCTHIKLSIRQVEKDAVSGLRNTEGAKYYACEKCGKAAGESVYITGDGNRYHSSLECSGLKRSIHEVSLDDAAHLKACSRCAAVS